MPNVPSLTNPLATGEFDTSSTAFSETVSGPSMRSLLRVLTPLPYLPTNSLDPGDLPQAINDKENQVGRRVCGLDRWTAPSPVFSTVLASKQYKRALNTAFNMPYMDPHARVSYHSPKLSSNTDDWARHPREYVAPYTSMIASSMTGKVD